MPRLIVGYAKVFALIYSGAVLIFMPRSTNYFYWTVSLILFTKSVIYLNFYAGDLIVDYEIFFLLPSSISDGRPVIKQTCGRMYMGFGSFLFLF